MKYLFLNDMEYLIHYRKKLLSTIILVPFLFLIIYIQSQISGLEMFHLSMGTNLNLEGCSLSELISFIYNITIFLFLVIDIYVKDIEYQLDFIFLRMSPILWYLKKTVYFIVIIVLIKIVQYLFITLWIVDRVSLADFLFLFIHDSIYVLFLQFLFLILYMVSVLILKNKLFSIFLFLIIFMVLPKNIYGLKNIEIYLWGIILINIIIGWIFKKWNKKIMERI